MSRARHSSKIGPGACRPYYLRRTEGSSFSAHHPSRVCPAFARSDPARVCPAFALSGWAPTGHGLGSVFARAGFRFPVFRALRPSSLAGFGFLCDQPTMVQPALGPGTAFARAAPNSAFARTGHLSAFARAGHLCVLPRSCPRNRSAWAFEATCPRNRRVACTRCRLAFSPCQSVWAFETTCPRNRRAAC